MIRIASILSADYRQRNALADLFRAAGAAHIPLMVSSVTARRAIALEPTCRKFSEKADRKNTAVKIATVGQSPYYRKTVQLKGFSKHGNGGMILG